MSIRAALAAALLLGCAAPICAQAPSPAARAEAFRKLPYWNGYWVSEFQAGTTIGGFAPAILDAREHGTAFPANFMSLNGASAPWNEEGKRRQAERAKTAAGRKAMGWGYPMMMNSAAPVQFLITPEETLVINPYGDVRHIYTDGRKHPGPDDLWPTVWGDSVGHWEGGTLVVDTIAVKNPNAYFHGAPPLSEQAHYVERIRMEGDKIVSDIVIEDPVTLTGPWKARLSFIRDDGFDRMIQIDYDNDRTGFDGQANTIEPTKGEE